MNQVPEPLTPWMKSVVWGSGVLQARYGKAFDAKAPLGETWEASAVPGFESRVGADQRLLSELLAEHPDRYAGADGAFPLLVKLLAPSQWLSVQVHPDDAQAGAEERGKHEAWCVLEAEADAEVLLGLAEGVDRAAFEAAVAEGSEAAIRRVMRAVRVAPGDVIDVPPGTVHALGPGVTLVEVQQPSDLTYRIYDWDRVGFDGEPRELHLERALKVLDPDSRPLVVSGGDLGTGDHAVLTNPHFRLRRVLVEGALEVPLDDLAVVVTARGQGTLRGEEASESLDLARGSSCLVPRGVGMIRLEGASLEVLIALPPLR